MLADLGAWFACLEGIAPESAGGAPVLWLAQACRKLCSLLAISETRKILRVIHSLFLSLSWYAYQTHKMTSYEHSEIIRKQEILWTTRRQSQYDCLITGTRTKEKIDSYWSLWPVQCWFLDLKVEHIITTGLWDQHRMLRFKRFKAKFCFQILRNAVFWLSALLGQ